MSLPTEILDALRTAAGPMRSAEIRDAVGLEGSPGTTAVAGALKNLLDRGAVTRELVDGGFEYFLVAGWKPAKRGGGRPPNSTKPAAPKRPGPVCFPMANGELSGTIQYGTPVPPLKRASKDAPSPARSSRNVVIVNDERAPPADAGAAAEPEAPTVAQMFDRRIQTIALTFEADVGGDRCIVTVVSKKHLRELLASPADSN